MKKGTITLIIILAVVAIILLWFTNVYNKLVVAQESVETEWANVESQYQRRADLIPNLVNTVKGYAAHEENTFKAVVEARAKATQTTVDFNNLTPETLEAYQQAQSQVGNAIGRLLMISENYPELKANENFKILQEQLEGTENRIQISRNTFNNTAKSYNQMIRRFPNNLIANMFNFDRKVYFQADAAAATAPQVEF